VVGRYRIDHGFGNEPVERQSVAMERPKIVTRLSQSLSLPHPHWKCTSPCQLLLSLDMKLAMLKICPQMSVARYVFRFTLINLTSPLKIRIRHHTMEIFNLRPSLSLSPAVGRFWIGHGCWNQPAERQSVAMKRPWIMNGLAYNAPHAAGRYWIGHGFGNRPVEQQSAAMERP